MKKSFPLVLAILAGLTIFFSVSGEGQCQTRVEEKTITIDPTKPVSLSFQDVNGDLKIIPEEGKRVHIRTEKEALTKDKKLASRLLEETKLEIKQRENKIEAKITYPRLRAIFFPFRDYRRVRVSTEISLPPHSFISARLVDGAFRAEGEWAEIQVTTVDGSIWLEKINSRLHLRTVDGRINIIQGKGVVDAGTVDGDIRVKGEFELPRLETTDGDIMAELAPGTKINSPWKLTTVDGFIEIALPADISANFVLESIDGSLTCDFPFAFIEKAESRRISGRLNQGGPLITLRTVDGRIRLTSLPQEK